MYEPGTTTVPHKFQIGDPVLVRRHRSSKLEPRWKRPYLVLLTSPAPTCAQLPLPSPPQPTGLALLTLTGLSTGNSSLPPTTGKRLFSLIRGASEALKVTNPKAVTSCWLCLTAGHPYYERSKVDGSITVTSDASHCPWGQSKNSLTLAEISGSGKCIGVVPPSHRRLCNHT
jgi:hypothetical protein